MRLLRVGEVDSKGRGQVAQDEGPALAVAVRRRGTGDPMGDRDQGAVLSREVDTHGLLGPRGRLLAWLVEPHPGHLDRVRFIDPGERAEDPHAAARGLDAVVTSLAEVDLVAGVLPVRPPPPRPSCGIGPGGKDLADQGRGSAGGRRAAGS